MDPILAVMNETSEWMENKSLWANNAGIVGMPPEHFFILQSLSIFYFVSFSIGLIGHSLFLLVTVWGLQKIGRYQYLVVCFIGLSLLDLMQLLWALASGITIMRNTWDFGLIPCYAVYVFETFSKTLPPSFLLLICFENWGLLGKAFRRCEPYTRLLGPMALLTILVAIYEADLFYRNVEIKTLADGRESCEISLELAGRRVQSWISLILYFLGPLILLSIVDCLKLVPRSTAFSDPISRLVLILLLTRFFLWLPLWIYETLIESKILESLRGEVILFFFAQVFAFLPAGYIFPFIYAKIVRKLVTKEQLEVAGFEYSELSCSGASLNISAL